MSNESSHEHRIALKTIEQQLAQIIQLLNQTKTDTIEQQLALNNEQLAHNDAQLAQILQLLNQTKTDTIDQQSSQKVQLLNRTEAEEENKTLPRDCLDLQRTGVNESGQYEVYPDDGGHPFFVFCDMETDGGGWTVSKNTN